MIPPCSSSIAPQCIFNHFSLSKLDDTTTMKLHSIYFKSSLVHLTPASSRRCQLLDSHSQANSHLDVDTASSSRLALAVFQASSDAYLRAASNLRVQTFYECTGSFGLEEHMKYMAKAEFEALKERIAGKRQGFKRVACVVATIPIPCHLYPSKDIFSLCKVDVQKDGMHIEELVVGSLDVNQALVLPGELCGTRPKGSEAEHGRAYLSNVCVAKELHRKGIGSTLIKHAKKIAQLWGMSDVYVHVVAENEAANRLYEKNGFVKENEETASDARLMCRPKRLLLWSGF